MPGFSATGQHGAIKWGYLTAIECGPWRYEKSGEHGTFTAQVTHRDEFRASQAPLVVVVPVGQSQWRWPVRELQQNGSTVTVTVGPRERS